MHNNFLDKNRRYISLRNSKVETVVPEYFKESYPKFITLLEKYYSYVDTTDSTELLKHLFATRDINETDFTLLTYIEDELLLGDAYFEGFASSENDEATRQAYLRATANFSSTLFRSKGTKFAIEWFFRSFYGLDAEVLYPKENIFKLNDIESGIGADSLRYITDDKLYQTFALLVRVGLPISKWKDLFKLFGHPAGMYLGGEVLVEDEAISLINTLMQDSSATQYITPSYVLTTQPADSADEGTTFDFNLEGSNVRNNTAGLYWYVEHVTTSDSDFVTTIPTEASPQYLSVYDSDGTAVASFSLETLIDTETSPAEGNETFKVHIIDDEDRQVITPSTITINDVIASYTITSDRSPEDSANEGDLITFIVSGTDVPNSGNTTLNWYVNHIDTTDSDFIGVVPSSGSPQSFSVVDDSGRFTLRSLIDNTVEGVDQFSVSVKTTSGVLKDTFTMNLHDVAASFSISSSDVYEGQTLSVDINCDSSAIGDSCTWVISGAAASDDRLTATSGGLTLSAASASYDLLTLLKDDSLNNGGSVSATITVTNGNYGTPPTDNTTISILDSAASYTLTADPITAAEGDAETVTFTVGGTNIPDSDVEFYIVHGTTDNADFSVTPPLTGTRETVTISGSTGSTTLTLVDNSETDDQSFTAYIASTSGTALANTSFTITGITYTVTPSSTSLNEGSSVTIDVTSGVDGTFYYWINPTDASGVGIPTATAINEDDFTVGYGDFLTRGSFSVSSGVGSFVLTLSNDYNREGTEYFKVYISTGDFPAAAVASSSNITVNDTSVPVYTIETVNNSNTVTSSFVEPSSSGSTLKFKMNLTATTNDTETLYAEVNDIVSARIDGGAPMRKQINNVSSSFTNQTIGELAFNDVWLGDSTGTLTVGINDYVSNGGTQVASTTFTISDAAGSATLTNDLSVTDSANEDVTINWSLASGKNLEPGTYYYHTSDMVRKITNASIANNTALISMSDTTGVLTGMRVISDSVDFGSATVDGVTSTTVTMSGTQTGGTIASGAKLRFIDSDNLLDFTSSYPAYGTFAVASNTGTFRTDVAHDSDYPSGGSEDYTFQVSKDFDGSSVASKVLTINDFDYSDVITLSGTTSVPNSTSSYEIEDDSFAYWIFYTNGTVYKYFSNYTFGSGPVFTQFEAGTEWDNQTPSITHYIRFSLYSASGSGGYVHPTLNTWLPMTSNRTIGASNSFDYTYESLTLTFKVEIATDSLGSNIVATGYYRATATSAT